MAGEKGAAPAAPSALDDEALITAARLLCRGVNVVPLNGDNRPAMSWKAMQDARQIDHDADRIDTFLLGWWERPGYGVAAVTGAVSGIVVVDLDDDDARALVEEICGGRLPETVIARTRRGHHVWFQHPGGKRPNRAHVADVGLDARGDGGYVVCPPTGGRTWLISPWEHLDGMWPPAPMPEALRDLLWPPKPEIPKTTATKILSAGGGNGYARTALAREAEAVRSAPVGQRNDQLNRSVFTVARFLDTGELDEATVIQEFVTAARAAGLTDGEIIPTIQSGIEGRRG